jgi:hypothetical protein
MTLQQMPNSSPVIARVFADLAGQWRDETAHLSDDAVASAHPNYRALIALGKRVIPFMLGELQGDNPEHWFDALEQITGENPVRPEQRGNIHQMAAAWIEWGKRHGYLA